MPIHDSGDFSRRRRPLSQREIDTTGQRISNIVGDPARDEFSDDEFAKWSERQVDRTTDINGNIINTHIEPFKPEVTRQDLNLDGSVGDKADNFRRDVLGVKKVMSKAGAFDFDPGSEPTTAVNDRFKTAIRNFQAGNDLKVDGKIFPGGPTVHMLGRTAIGQENGQPSGFDAADFKRNFGRDPNLNLSGNRIFGIPGEGGGGETSGTQVAGRFGRSGRGGLGRSGKKQKEKPSIRDRIEEQIRKQIDPKHDNPRRRLPKEKIKPSKPEIGETPASIVRYPDGRVYILVDPRGKIQVDRKKPGKVSFFDIDRKSKLDPLRRVHTDNYPAWEDRRSFQEREAAGLEGYVYGPVWDKNGKKSYIPLRDPSTGSIFGGTRFLRIPVKGGIFLTLAQIKAMGLSKWHVAD